MASSKVTSAQETVADLAKMHARFLQFLRGTASTGSAIAIWRK
jgi:hypothetical protein